MWRRLGPVSPVVVIVEFESVSVGLCSDMKHKSQLTINLYLEKHFFFLEKKETYNTKIMIYLPEGCELITKLSLMGSWPLTLCFRSSISWDMWWKGFVLCTSLVPLKAVFFWMIQCKQCFKRPTPKVWISRLRVTCEQIAIFSHAIELFVNTWCVLIISTLGYFLAAWV